jgi:asparagine synthase (glutamine-hydrolysing)
VEHADLLLAALRSAVEGQCEGREAGILFSGGLDSAVIAKLASERVRARLYTIGMAGSHDLAVGERTAEGMGLEWQGIVLTRERVLRSLTRLADIIRTESPLVLSFEMPLLIVAEEAEEDLLLSGQGADELFGGYARYASMGQDELSASLASDLDALLTVGARRERDLAAHFGKTIRHPFLHEGVVRAAESIPLPERVGGSERKRVLRDAARLLGLDKAASRPKKAAQYGSGVMKAMRAEAQRRGVPLSELVQELRDCETL